MKPFFGVSIDLLIRFLGVVIQAFDKGLTIKPFDNQAF
jgi:hypothetical protein